jgi:DNA/RNA-binding domain of Phe-tRNA-synthetase-like protein
VSFRVAPECIQLGLRAGALVFRNLRILATCPEIRSEIAREVQAVRTRFSTSLEVRKDPLVVSFQELLRKVGVSPREEKPSVERLLTYALKRGDLPAINSLVDAYNLVSVRTCCSLGAHDLDRIALPIELRLLTGSESFRPLGRAQPEIVTPGEYGYVDAGNRVLCRLDILQADFSKVTPETTNVLLIIEGTTTHSAETLETAFADTIELITRHCGGTPAMVIKPPL